MAGLTLDDFDFDLPEKLIALRPVRPRPASRLLVATRSVIRDRVFSDLPDVLRPGDRLVFNDTKVIPARLFGSRKRVSPHGPGLAQIEVTLLEPGADGARWRALARPAKRLAAGDEITFGETLTARVLDRQGGEVDLLFGASGDELDAAIDAQGMMPLPPYIARKRAADAQDATDYQTVFARTRGAVAAPTASLHFDEGLLEALGSRGVEFSFVTLHVGAGTFLPVTVTDIDTHKMHAEYGSLSTDVASDVRRTQQAGGRVIPVGTTALRLLETAARDGEIAAFEGKTDIFIRPGHRFRACDGLITNFHLPKSTLMMLVSALMGMERMREIYAHAIAHEYRFFSYGDGSLLLPED